MDFPAWHVGVPGCDEKVRKVPLFDEQILSGQFIIGHFGEDSLTKPPFGVTSAEVVINCPDFIHPKNRRITWQFCDRDLVGVVSSRDPFKGES